MLPQTASLKRLNYASGVRAASFNLELRRNTSKKNLDTPPSGNTVESCSRLVSVTLMEIQTSGIRAETRQRPMTLHGYSLGLLPHVR
jgi:hypothetical protein